MGNKWSNIADNIPGKYLFLQPEPTTVSKIISTPNWEKSSENWIASFILIFEGNIDPSTLELFIKLWKPLKKGSNKILPVDTKCQCCAKVPIRSCRGSKQDATRVNVEVRGIWVWIKDEDLCWFS